MWLPTWRAWLLALVLVAALSVGVLYGIHPFLAVDKPNDSGVFVVEGWLPLYALTGVVARCPSYKLICTTGGPTHTDRGSSDFADTYASVAQQRLLSAGVPSEKLRAIAAAEFRRDRTYGSAVAVREWARSNHVDLSAFNVVTLGPHARRSRLLFQEAFGSSARVGIVAMKNSDYDDDSWWRFSEGVKETLSETAAYVYARIFFRPD